MIRKLLRLLLLLGIFVSNATASDSIPLWQKAQEATESGDYEEAYQIYQELSRQRDSIYQQVYGEEIEDLRSVYQIDELKLQNKQHANRLLSYFIGGALFLSIAVLICLFVFRRQNKKLTISRQKLEEAKMLAEESVKNKSLFLSNMSHEVRTPLNALSGFSNILSMEGIDNDTIRECDEIIRLNSDLLLKLINDVVDISCIDLEHMAFNISSCDAVALCKYVVQTMEKIKHTQADILFHSELDSLTINTDSSRLQQVLINLIVNASKFTKQGQIVLSLEQKDKEAYFAVTDTGCGIAPELHSRLFGRFEKLDEKAQGTGLGLSICRLIIRRLGGDIQIDSSYTDGARFVFTHPLAERSDV
ncbi:ATP-binding protein [Bacteroides sp.]